MTITYTISRRSMLAAAALSITGWRLIQSPAVAAIGVLTPEMFGAKGDGHTDDSAAFAALSARVSASGGGTVQLRKTTYLIGTQIRDASGVPQSRTIMEFVGCTRPLIVRGNGARLRCAAGQAYGPHDANGRPISTKMTRIERKGANKVRPYSWMILAERCSGPVTISDLELDGNADSFAVVPNPNGGVGGWQYGCSGVALRDNTGSETLADIYSHDHALDGFYIDGYDGPTPGAKKSFSRLRADRNARQGMSIVGGHGYQLSNCTFTRTGRGKIHTSPRAGLDIEAQRDKKIRQLSFDNCVFSNNAGCAMVADSGDSAEVTFANCTFIAPDNWSAWAKKPGFRFSHCTFAGTIVHAFGDADPRRATQFTDCRFSDDPGLSPTGALQLRKNLVADIPRAQNVLFARCSFVLQHEGVLPWSSGPIWQDCVFSQRSAVTAYTRGTFKGRNRIDGAVDIGKSTVEGVLIVNGRVIPPRAT